MQYNVKTRSDGVPCLYLDLEDAKIDGVEPNTPLLYFPINKFTKIYVSVGQEHKATDGFIAINRFLSTLSKSDSEILAISMIIMHNRIRECFIGDHATGTAGFTEVAKTIDELLLDVNTKLNLPKKLYDFIVAEIPINGASEGALRPQDIEEMTYRHGDIVELYTLSFMCKLLLPIFGAVIHYLTVDGGGLEDKVRELHCTDCMINTINTMYHTPKRKLQAYIHAVVVKKYPPMSHKANRSLLHYGYTSTWAEIASFVTFLVRNVINMNVYRDDSNLITVLNSGVSNLIETAIKKVNKDRRVEERKDLSVSDERQQSEMELHSVSSIKTADWPIVVACFSKQVITEVLDEYSLDKRVHEALAQHILVNQTQPNPVATLMIKLVFGHRLSGVTMLKYLNISQISQMMATVQLLANSNGYSDLANFTTAKRTGMVYNELPGSLRQLLLGWRRRREYKRCVEMITDSPLRETEIRKLFDDMMTKLVTELTSHEYVYNSAPEMAAYLSDYVDGATVEADIDLIVELYGFIFDFRIGSKE